MSYRAVTVAESTAAAIDDDLHRGRAAGAAGATATASADKQAAGGALTSPSVASSTKTTTATTTATATAPPSNWLLRLFQSEFFNTWIAVSYLHKYPDAVGVQHYLCRELRRFPVDELLFLLPQLW